MAAIGIEFETKYLDLPTQDELMRVINLREKELGQTTKQAGVGIIISTLKILRGDTRVALTRADNISSLNVTSRYTPSFKREGSRVKRILRNGISGKEVVPSDDVRIIWDVKKYKKTELYLTFYIEDRISDSLVRKYLVVSKSQQKAETLIKTIHANRVRRNQKLAKFVLGIAMNKVNSALKVSDGVLANVIKTGIENVVAYVTETGYDSGEVEIKVHDKIDYAAKALKSGVNFVLTAVLRALNQSVGLIMRKLKKEGRLTDSLSVPFPDAKGV